MAKPSPKPKDEKPEAGAPMAPAVEPPPAAKAIESPTPSPVSVAPAPAMSKTDAVADTSVPNAARYRVWAHGTLQRNGKTYQPGDELTLHPDDAAQIPCLEKA